MQAPSEDTARQAVQAAAMVEQVADLPFGWALLCAALISSALVIFAGVFFVLVVAIKAVKVAGRLVSAKNAAIRRPSTPIPAGGAPYE